MARQLSDFTNRVAAVLQDAAGKLSAADRDLSVKQAIVQRYSKDRPREMVTEQAGSGTNDQALPQSDAAKFEENFSVIRKIEYPVDEVPAILLDLDEWELFRKTDGLKVRMLDATPAAAEAVRMTWTARHKDDGSTVADEDFDAVCDLAAAIAFEQLAARFTQAGDATIGADTVNYRTKSQEYLALAKAARKRYFDHMGIEDGAQSGSDGAKPGPAIGTAEMDINMGWGGDRVTHGRRTR